MQVITGTVVAGQVVIEGLTLAEGQLVTVLTRDEEDVVHLSPEEDHELGLAIAEANRGETIPAEELFRRLRDAR